MRHSPMAVAIAATLALALSACVNLDLSDTTSDTPAPSAESMTRPSVAPATFTSDTPLEPYTTLGLTHRISALHDASTAKLLEQGFDVPDIALPGSAKVLLADRITSNTRFELPEEQPGDFLLVEMNCSAHVASSFHAVDAQGFPVGSGQSSTCAGDESTGPDGFGFGSAGTGSVRELEVTVASGSAVEISVIAFTYSSPE